MTDDEWMILPQSYRRGCVTREYNAGAQRIVRSAPERFRPINTMPHVAMEIRCKFMVPLSHRLPDGPWIQSNESFGLFRRYECTRYILLMPLKTMPNSHSNVELVISSQVWKLVLIRDPLFLDKRSTFSNGSVDKRSTFSPNYQTKLPNSDENILLLFSFCWVPDEVWTLYLQVWDIKITKIHFRRA